MAFTLPIQRVRLNGGVKPRTLLLQARWKLSFNAGHPSHMRLLNFIWLLDSAVFIWKARLLKVIL
jgi:hypothetical protein